MTPGLPRDVLRRMFDAAVASALPDKCLPAFLPPPPKGRTIVIGAGKASAAMARAVETHWPGELSGLVVTRYGHRVSLTWVEIWPSSSRGSTFTYLIKPLKRISRMIPRKWFTA